MLCFFIFPVLAFVASTVAWALWFRYSHFCKIVRKIPGPRPRFLVGNALECLGGGHVLRSQVHERWAFEYGEIFRIFIGTKVYVVISSPELVEIIVKNPKLLGKGADYNFLVPWLGLGLLTSSGDKWKSQRRLLTTAFHFRILEDFFDTFNEQSSILCEKISRLCKANGKIETHIDELISLCTLDVICETAMGCKVNAQTEETEYVKAFKSISPIILKRMMNPLYSFDFIFDRTALGKKYHQCLEVLHKLTNNVIKKKCQEVSCNSSCMINSEDFGIKNRRPLLDLLMESLRSGKMDGHDVRANVDTFTAAGNDTTAMALSWFLYCMASNQDCQEKVREELIQQFGETDRPCTRQDLPELKYLECCIKEALRLYPSAPAFLRPVHNDLQIGQYQIPKGCNLAVSIYALHHNPQVYANPFTFNPDRFTAEQSKGRHPYAYIPFSAGPRNCIGQQFAMAEETVLASSLLRWFRFDLSPTAPKPIPSMDITLNPVNGIHLLVSPLRVR
nr:CYP4AP2 protein [Diaphanosoma celebensis]